MRFFITIVFTSFYLYGITQEYYLEKINTSHGLSQNDIVEIYQDSRGYLWFGTNDGLNCYNGLEFKVYKVNNSNPHSISSNFISGISEDADSNLWVSTQTNGICKFDIKTEKFITLANNDSTPNLFRTNNLYAIFCDSKNRIWASDYRGVNYVTRNEENKYTVTRVKGLPDSVMRGERHKCYSIQESPDGRILVSMNVGIAEIVFNGAGEPYLTPLFVNRGIFDVRDLIFIDTTVIVCHYYGITAISKNFEITDNISNCTYPAEAAWYGKILRNSQIWLGCTEGIHIIKYTPNKNPKFNLIKKINAGPSDYQLPKKAIKCLYLDANGILWIGTSGGGIAKYNYLSKPFRSYAATDEQGSISQNLIRTIYQDKYNNLWIGTENGDIDLLKNGSKNYSSGFINIGINNLGSKIVYDIIEVNSLEREEFWVGTGYPTRMAMIKKIENTYKIYPGYVPIQRGIIFNLQEDEFGNIWMADYNGGLFRARLKNGSYQVDQFEVVNSNIPSDVVRSLLEDIQGRLWIGTSNGLSVLSREEKQKENPAFQNFFHEKNNDSSLSFNYILPIIQTKSKDIWIGTMGGGMNKLIFNGSLQNSYFEHLTEKDGLANNTIKQIIEDKSGKLWIGSNRGVSRYNPSTGKIRNFNIKDGLQDYEFGELADCILKDGEIIMGGVNGFNAFYPEDIKEDTTPPRVVLNDLMIYGKVIGINEIFKGKTILKKAINHTEEITLGHSTNNFTVSFAALHFGDPEYNRYQYKLEGYDENWNNAPTNAPFARYTNLNAGEYKLNIIACNRDGYWTREPKKLNIIIKPPYWKSWWFRSIILVVISLIFTSFYIIKITLVNRQNKLLEELVQKRTGELMEINTELEESREEIFAQKEEILQQRDELEHHKDNLENIVEERTNELKLAKEKAEESDKLKSAFIANMSHEIRTPMNAIIGFSSLIEDGFISEENRANYLQQIRTNSQNLLVLINDILDISLIEANQLKLNNKDFSLNILINDNYLAAKVNSSKLEVELVLNNNLEKENLFIRSDFVRTNQIVSNLLNNAQKFTHKGQIILSTYKENEDIIIAVKDTGIGISKEDLKNIFERFRKIESDNTILYPGVGLGLSISNRLAELLHCKLWAKSELKKGSEFFFQIPAHLVFKKHRKDESNKKELPDIPNWKGSHILIVEDEMANSEYLNRMLIKTGCKISFAYDGKEALNYFKNDHKFDVVLMDIKMPVMNGIDAFNEIRNISPNQCIIAQTAFALKTDEEKYLNLGFSNYIAKPIHRNTLFRIIQECIDKKKINRSLL